MNKFLDLCKKTNLLGLVGAIISVVAVFLPYVTATVSIFGISSTQSVNALSGWEGWVILVVMIITLVSLFEEYIKKAAPKFFDSAFGKKFEIVNKPKSAIAAAVIIVICNVFTLIQSGNVSSSYGSFAKVGMGIGFFLLFVGAAFLIAYAILSKENVLPFGGKKASKSTESKESK